ncbi:homeobox protein SEBOX [Bombina bombina]|uniref:homeobox protein SEBOX n=1 Tax=Bombina bombina TaxID=8345 RepID=UPI00235A4B21|nr:homeobox protein SEBOX [Bombina bombina]
MENLCKQQCTSHLEKAPVVPAWSSLNNLPTTGPLNKPQDSAPQVIEGTNGQRKRKRTLYSKWQQVELESVFAVVPYPDITTREYLANVIRLPESKVQVWFQNRRARKSKSGKLDRSIYRRASSYRNSQLALHKGSSIHGCFQRDPLVAMQYSLNHTVQYVQDGHHGATLQQSQGQQFLQPSYSLYQQYLGGEESMCYNSGQSDICLEHFTSNKTSPGYGYEAKLYDTQFIDLEQLINTQIQSLELFPHTMNENGSPTSLGYISDVIYNAAIVTNVGEF